jgi:hypothetical protein
VSATRALAGAQIMQGRAGMERGRRAYQQAAQMLSGRGDAYSIYSTTYTYRTWSGSEYGLGNLPEARDRLKDALRIASQMPDWFPLKQFELRQCATGLMTLGNAFMRTGDLRAYEEVLVEAAAAVESLYDDISRELRGRIYATRAEFERIRGDASASERFAAQAVAAVETLPAASPGRLAVLAGITIPEPVTSG